MSYTLKYSGEEIDDSLDTVNNLLTQDNWDKIIDATEKRHEHSNKSILDNTTASFTPDYASTIIDNKANIATNTSNINVNTTNIEANLRRINALENLSFKNISVSKSSFVSDTTYTDYPFRAPITLTGVTANMMPIVIFSVTDATCGKFSPCAESYAGGIYIYAKTQPDSSVSIPSIICLPS